MELPLPKREIRSICCPLDATGKDVKGDVKKVAVAQKEL